MGEDGPFDEVERLVTQWFEMKIGRLGEDAKDQKEMVILGRVVRWTAEGVECEANPRHLERLEEIFGFDQGSKVGGTNGERSKGEEE